jgi:hypothetical protein
MIEMYLHKPPMKSILYCVVKAYSIHKGLSIINSAYDLDLTEENICSWKHISKEDAEKKLNSVQSPDECDATKVK